MIHNDDELKTAHECIAKIERTLLEARRHQTPAQYGFLSKPFLLELQRRQDEILEYLMLHEAATGTSA